MGSKCHMQGKKNAAEMVNNIDNESPVSGNKSAAFLTQLRCENRVLPTSAIVKAVKRLPHYVVILENKYGDVNSGKCDILKLPGAPKLHENRHPPLIFGHAWHPRTVVFLPCAPLKGSMSSGERDLMVCVD